jgi:hypothetical protein
MISFMSLLYSPLALPVSPATLICMTRRARIRLSKKRAVQWASRYLGLTTGVMR